MGFRVLGRESQRDRVLGFWILVFRASGFRLLGFRVLGSSGLGFWGLGFRIQGLGSKVTRDALGLWAQATGQQGRNPKLQAVPVARYCSVFMGGTSRSRKC